MKKYIFFIALISMALPAYANELSFSEWKTKFTERAKLEGISEETLNSAFANINAPIDRVLVLDKKQPEQTLSYKQYKKLVINQKRIDTGRQMYAKHKAILKEVSEKIGVEEKYILALWGVETDFGRRTGDFSIIHSLATLAYDGRRSEFFTKELINALKIVEKKNIRPEELRGSWAGAMGQCQFMPSSYLKFAYDYNTDGKADIWHTKPDVFASIANYLATTGWKRNEGWGMRVYLPEGFNLSLAGRDKPKPLSEWIALGVKDRNGKEIAPRELNASLINLEEDKEKLIKNGEYYLAFPNYNVLMDWNRSTYFATSVGLLADLIDKTPVVHEVKN